MCYQWNINSGYGHRKLCEEIKKLTALAIRYRRLYRFGECTLYDILNNSRRLRELKKRLRELETEK
jgi:hypothetical protein